MYLILNNWANIVTPSLPRGCIKEGTPFRPADERGTTFIYLKSKTDRKRGNYFYRNVNNNNHNNSLLFSRRLFDAVFSSEREWVERVEPHPLRAPFFLPPPTPPSLPSLPHPMLFPSRLNPLLHLLVRNIHWRPRYRLCAPRRSSKSCMNRASFRDVPRCSHVPRKTRICGGRSHNRLDTVYSNFIQAYIIILLLVNWCILHYYNFSSLCMSYFINFNLLIEVNSLK